MYLDDRHIPVRVLRLGGTDERPEPFEGSKSSLFIKGPVPVAWLAAAAKLPGKALNVGLAIHWLAGMSAGKPFKMTRRSQELFALSDDAARDGLQRLEGAGLITVLRRPGQRPLISILRK